MIKIVATALPELPVADKVINEIIGNEATLEIVPLPFNTLESVCEKPEWFKTLIQADALLVRSGIIDKWLIDQLMNCKVIALHGAGVDQVDVKSCYEKGIVVTNVPGGNARAAAELTVSLMLDCLRNVSRANLLIKNGEWENSKIIGNELGSQRIGIVGIGNIGLKVARLCHAFGAQVKYYDKYSHQDLPKYLSYLDLPDLLKWASIVTLHIPLNEETTNLIGEKELKLIGSDGILINVARGAIVNEKALINCLNQKAIKWVACDVFTKEPPDFQSELFKFANTTFTPHIGGSTYECLETIAKRAILDILKICREEEGRPCN